MKEKNITAQRLKERRLEKGLTLEKLSALTNISKSSLQRYENENMIINTPISKLEALVKALDVTIPYLLGKKNILYTQQQFISNSIQDELQDLINSHFKKISPCLSRLCKYERIEKDITEKYVATKSGVSLDEYLDFKNNAKNIGSPKIVNILSFLGFDAPLLIGWLSGFTTFLNVRLRAENKIRNTLFRILTDVSEETLDKLSEFYTHTTAEELQYVIIQLEKDIGTSKTHDAQINKIKRALDKVINENID